MSLLCLQQTYLSILKPCSTYSIVINLFLAWACLHKERAHVQTNNGVQTTTNEVTARGVTFSVPHITVLLFPPSTLFGMAKHQN